MDDSKTDSMSIENQRHLLDKHISEMDIGNAEIREFVDNGYSGTNFERPAVQELLELVRQGRVNCILIKDMSRFGRNMIDTGYYVERIFPLYRVRLISVSDCFDSADYGGDTGGMDIALKFLVHEQYSRDLSNKIKSAKYAKMLRGEAVRKNCFFGYKLNEARKMVVDEPAAETVRIIFNLALDGMSILKIGERLYEDNRPSPGMHKGWAKHNGCIWTLSYICKVLMEEQYTGTYIVGRTRSAGVGSKSVIGVTESEWVKIPNHHPAVIDKATFDEVRRIIIGKSENLRKRATGTRQRNCNVCYLLQSKVICGYCGHTMIPYSSRNAAFRCGFTLVAPDSKCHRLAIHESILEATVMKKMREKAQAILNAANGTPSHPENLPGHNERIMLF